MKDVSKPNPNPERPKKSSRKETLRRLAEQQNSLQPGAQIRAELAAKRREASKENPDLRYPKKGASSQQSEANLSANLEQDGNGESSLTVLPRTTEMIHEEKSYSKDLQKRIAADNLEFRKQLERTKHETTHMMIETGQEVELMSDQAINDRVKASLEASKKQAIQDLGRLMWRQPKIFSDIFSGRLRCIYENIEQRVREGNLRQREEHAPFKQALEGNKIADLGLILTKCPELILESNNIFLNQILETYNDAKRRVREGQIKEAYPSDNFSMKDDIILSWSELNNLYGSRGINLNSRMDNPNTIVHQELAYYQLAKEAAYPYPNKKRDPFFNNPQKNYLQHELAFEEAAIAYGNFRKRINSKDFEGDIRYYKDEIHKRKLQIEKGELDEQEGEKFKKETEQLESRVKKLERILSEHRKGYSPYQRAFDRCNKTMIDASKTALPDEGIEALEDLSKAIGEKWMRIGYGEANDQEKYDFHIHRLRRALAWLGETEVLNSLSQNNNNRLNSLYMMTQAEKNLHDVICSLRLNPSDAARTLWECQQLPEQQNQLKEIVDSTNTYIQRLENLQKLPQAFSNFTAALATTLKENQDELAAEIKLNLITTQGLVEPAETLLAASQIPFLNAQNLFNQIPEQITPTALAFYVAEASKLRDWQPQLSDYINSISEAQENLYHYIDAFDNPSSYQEGSDDDALYFDV